LQIKHESDYANVTERESWDLRCSKLATVHDPHSRTYTHTAKLRVCVASSVLGTVGLPVREAGHRFLAG